MDDSKISTKNEKELKTQSQTIRIYSQNLGMEFGIFKYFMLILKKKKKEIMKGFNKVVIKAAEYLERKKITNTSKYWKRILSNKLRRKKENSTTEEHRSFSKANSAAEISSKGLAPGQFSLYGTLGHS